MFEDWSPEAEQTAHNHTYTFNIDRNTDIGVNANDIASYATTYSTSYFITDIEDMNGDKHRIRLNNLKFELKDDEIYLINDNGERIHICGAASTEMQLDKLKRLASNLSEETMVDKLVKKQVFELFESGGVHIEKNK